MRIQDGQRVVKDGSRGYKATPAKPLFKHEKAEAPESVKKPKRPMVKKAEGKVKVTAGKKKAAGGKKKAKALTQISAFAQEDPEVPVAHVTITG